MSNITVIDSIMGSGKTTWAINEIIEKDYDTNILFITPFLSEIERIKSSCTKRRIVSPENRGSGKIGNIATLLENEMDIASTHELFRRFDDGCKNALKEKRYTLILDETFTAVEPYHFMKKDDYKYLLSKGDIEETEDGMIKWIGSELDTRFDDVRILAKNKCLFKVDDRFFLWHFPHELFELFENVYVMTYLFDGSLMKYYFDLYGLTYQTKSIRTIGNNYVLTDYYSPDKSSFRSRLNIYYGKLNDNISQKDSALSATWCESEYNRDDKLQLKNNFYNFVRHIAKAEGKDVLWTTYKKAKRELSGKGYTKGFLSCNSRATNDYDNATCLMYGVNWYENPEIIKFFKQHGISIDQNKIALAMMLQWIWRSNIRKPESKKNIYIYIPSRRMRTLFEDWLNE